MFIFDLDGTIIRDNETVGSGIVDKLRYIKEKGHFVTVATGRSKIESEQILEMICPNAPVILLDGQIVFTENKILSIHNIELYVLELFIHKFSNDYYIYVEDKDSIYAQDKRTALLYGLNKKCSMRNIKNKLTFPKNFLATRILIGQKNTICKLPDKTDLTNLVQQHIDIKYNHNKEWLIIKPYGMDKSNALNTVCNYCKTNVNNVIFFGNEINDIDLIKRVGFGVAMGNAVQEVKKVADCCINDISNDGVCLFLDAFVNFIDL